MELRVETSLDGTAWRDAVPRSAMDYFYSSGPRVYPWEWGYRWEASFVPVPARRVRISQYEDGGRFPWKIAEAYVYEDLGARPLGPTGSPTSCGAWPSGPGPRVRRPVDERADIGVLRRARRDRHTVHRGHTAFSVRLKQPC